MKFLLIFVLSISSVWAYERAVRTRADKFATASFSEQKTHPWPFALLSIGHNMQSYQDYSGSPYWHDGLDIRGNQDQTVFAAAGGKVVNIQNYIEGNPMYWEVAILDDEGFVWKYHHIARNSIPKEIEAAYASGGKVAEGVVIGNIVKWRVSSFGEVYHHLHMLVVGSYGQYINPFLLLEPLADTKAPVIKSIGLAKNHKPVSGNSITGAHALYVEASDLTLHDKFTLPPHKISYKMDGGEEVLVWEFIHLPSATNDEDYITDFYMKGTCGDYSCRKFYFNLNFTKSAPRAQMNLKSGNHEVEVTVEDIVGNKTAQSFQWTVK
jgi:hypothetical protein